MSRMLYDQYADTLRAFVGECILRHAYQFGVPLEVFEPFFRAVHADLTAALTAKGDEGGMSPEEMRNFITEKTREFTAAMRLGKWRGGSDDQVH